MVELLKALGRFIFLAGLLGRNVLISSATINREVAEGLYICYQNGWNKFAIYHNKKQQCLCFWIDEFKTTHSLIPCTTGELEIRKQFYKMHERFVEKRINNLLKLPILRKGKIIKLQENESLSFFQLLLQFIKRL